MKSTILLIPFFLSYFVFVFGAVEKKEKTYTERLKEVYQEKVEEGKELYEKGIEGAKEKYQDNLIDGKKLSVKSKEWVLKDLKNIGDWEYKVLTYGPGQVETIEQKLNELGDERWQCFWVESNKKEKNFYFKRTKMSYLSKVPTGAILRIMADFQNE